MNRLIYQKHCQKSIKFSKRKTALSNVSNNISLTQYSHRFKKKKKNRIRLNFPLMICNNSLLSKHHSNHTFSLTNRGNAIDARLHTAVSVGLVYSIISVHRFEDLMVPRFCWLLFLLQVS